MTVEEMKSLTPYERALLEELFKLRKAIEYGADKIAEAMRSV